MPMVEFNIPTEKVRLQASMPTPKKVELLTHWLKGARKAILTIPKCDGDGWTLAHSQATVRHVRFDFVDSNGNKAYVVIDRTKSALVA